MIAKGYSNPFLGVPSSYMHNDLNAARFSVLELGKAIAPRGLSEGGIPKDFAPFTVTFTGNGNVSKGAQEIFSLMPHTMVRPEDLPHLPEDTRQVFGCIVEEEDMFEQVAEHCRMAALMIYTELVMRHQGKPAPAPQTPPTRH